MIPKTASARWLAAIAAIAAAAAAMSLIFTIAASSQAEPLPEGSPERVAQTYILAIEDEDFEAAYALLHTSVADGCSPSEFQRRVRRGSDRDYRVTFDETVILSDGANVFLDTTEFYASSPFDISTNESEAVFFLQRDPDEWRIVRTPYPFTGCSNRAATATPTPPVPPPPEAPEPTEPEG